MGFSARRRPLKWLGVPIVDDEDHTLMTREYVV